MQIAGTNRPEGKGYVTAFAGWLKRYKVDDMDNHRLAPTATLQNV